VGGTHRFVFGKHSGAGAVEEVLKKNESRLKAQGIVLDEALVQRALDEAKELRARMIEDGHAFRAVDDHYRHMARLGISEEGLVELVLRLHALSRAAAGSA